MRKFLIGVFVIGLTVPLSCRVARGDDPLGGFLASHGFTRTALSRQPFGRLALPATINQKSRALLMVATACPISGLDQSSALKFGLAEQKTAIRVSGSLGASNERYRMSDLKSLALANGLLSNVRVAVLDLRTLNGDRLSGPVNGVFGCAEMRRLEAIVDCGRQTIYTRTPGAGGGTSAMLKQYLIRQGFTHVPMHVDAQRHFEVVCAINGRPSKMVVDTASVFTCINPRTAARAGISSGLTRMSASAAGNRRAEIRAGRAKEFSIGNFKVVGSELAVVDVSFDTLGIEHLTFNSAIIDIEGLSLYLRRSNRR